MWLWLLTQIAGSKRCFPRNVCHGVAVPCNRTFPLLMYRDLLQGGFLRLDKAGRGLRLTSRQMASNPRTFAINIYFHSEKVSSTKHCVIGLHLSRDPGAATNTKTLQRCWKGRIAKPQSFHCGSTPNPFREAATCMLYSLGRHHVMRTLAMLRLTCLTLWRKQKFSFETDILCLLGECKSQGESSVPLD